MTNLQIFRSCVYVHLLVVCIIFCVVYDSTAELNYRRPKAHFQLTPCQSAFTINIGNYIFDYDAKITGHYDKECTFLIESPPKSQMRLRVSLSIGNLETIETCAWWLKLFDFHSNATLIPLAEYCESTNTTDLLTYSNIMYILLNIPPEGSFQLHIET
ncbi:uncharacterized protein LOC126834178 [Adelges cooleyi]|uniref:uncharacterized protein LOC126834178 n=1 Tax=Adelges cooleyi TaxID=133065 RepID=UPI002180262B|nr:uncharacterized protein LOC126834178 [Adelges cooleyi]